MAESVCDQTLKKRVLFTKEDMEMAIIDFGCVKEEVITREEFTMKKALEVLKDETIAVIG